MKKPSIDFVQNHPLPGASLTNPRDNQLPYERPPEIVDLQEASQHIWNNLTKPENMPQLLRMLRRDIPVADIAQTAAYAGFASGKWNYDLSLQLIEPTMYMVMELAHKAGAKYVFSREMPDLNTELQDETGKFLDEELSQNDDMGLMVETEDGE